MPVGSGYTIEGQVTGKERFGGFQMEIVPSYKKFRAVEFSYQNRNGFWNPMWEGATPRDRQLEGGDKITMVPTRPVQIRDLLSDGEIIDEMQYLVLKASPLHE